MSYALRAVVVSRFRLDGGAMHGIVPRALWSREHVPDADNRIALVARCLVAEDAAAGLCVLFETGLGSRWSEKERRIYGIEGEDAPAALAAAGVDPASVTHVVHTHLHWDHAGGVVVEGAAGGAVLAFPRAEHVVSEVALRHAERPAEKDAGSFRSADLAPLLAAARLRVWRTGDPLLPGVEARVSSGHTPGLLVPIVCDRAGGPPVAFPTDLVPTRSHLPPHWGMAYDNAPLAIAGEKRALYAELASMGGGLLLYHDPEVETVWPTARAERDFAFARGTLVGPSAPSH